MSVRHVSLGNPRKSLYMRPLIFSSKKTKLIMFRNVDAVRVNLIIPTNSLKYLVLETQTVSGSTFKSLLSTVLE